MLRRGVRACCQGAETLLCQARFAKRSTYMKGLEVDPDAAFNTPAMLNDLKQKVQTTFPEGNPYRANVEKYCNSFLDIINKAESQEDAEEMLNRQYEEIQQDVVKESALCDVMAQWEPFHAATPPKVFANVKDIPANVREFRNFQHALATKGN